jgi:hypothetical protein
MERLIKLGREKIKDFQQDFDFYYSKYENKAFKSFDIKTIKFIYEKKYVNVYVVVEFEDDVEIDPFSYDDI